MSLRNTFEWRMCEARTEQGVSRFPVVSQIFSVCIQSSSGESGSKFLRLGFSEVKHGLVDMWEHLCELSHTDFAFFTQIAEVKCISDGHSPQPCNLSKKSAFMQDEFPSEDPH